MCKLTKISPYLWLTYHNWYFDHTPEFNIQQTKWHIIWDIKHNAFSFLLRHKITTLSNLLGSLDKSTRRFQRVDNILCRWVMHRKWEILLPNFINLKMNTMSIIAHMDV